MSGFKKFVERLTGKEKFYYSVTSKNGYENVLKDWNKLELTTVKDYHELYSKCDVLLLSDVFA